MFININKSLNKYHKSGLLPISIIFIINKYDVFNCCFILCLGVLIFFNKYDFLIWILRF